jgi:hypothetical protein
MQDASHFIADKVFPVVPVPKQTDKYTLYDRGFFNRDEMEVRAPGAESAGGGYEVTTATYSCDVWALHKDIADQVRANADSQFQLDREAAEYLTQLALIRRERKWAADHFTTSKWTTDLTGVSGSPSAGEFQYWGEAASKPIEVIRTGKRTVLESTGFMPNKLVLGQAVYDALLDHPDIVGRLDRGQTTGPAVVMRQNLAALFEVDEVLVMSAVYNSAVEGATNSHSFIGGKHALLVYSAPNPGLMRPSGGYTFAWSGFLGAGAMGNRIKRFRLERNAADRVEIEMAFDQKLIAADLGYFFDGAVA